MDSGAAARSGSIVVTVDRDLEDLVPGFMKNRVEDVAALRSALAARDLGKVRLIGHTLKGIGGSYGFTLISEIGRNIELAARAGDLKKLAQTIDQLETYLKKIKVLYV